MVGAHRFSLQLTGVQVLPELVVMHKCDNPSCVNPDHLSIGTHKQNTADAMTKGRMKNQFQNGYDERRRHHVRSNET